MTACGQAYGIVKLLGHGKGGYSYLAEREGLLWYVDCECNDSAEPWNFENWGVRCWSRTPEFERYLAESEGKPSANG